MAFNDYALVARYLDTNGNGTGTKNATGTYASDTEFYYQPASDEVVCITRLIITLADTGPLDSGKYGNNITLSGDDGVGIQATQGKVTTDFTDGVAIQQNGCFHRQTGNANLVSDYGAGDDFLSVEYRFSDFGVDGLELNGRGNDKLSVIVNGDFSGLTQHYFMAQGFRRLDAATDKF